MTERKPTPHLNTKELELVSAYLDGQLPESQMKQVRQRLSQDPAFKQAYQDLGATRRVLRSAPRIKRRRSFTLTPEMVHQPVRAWNLQRASSMMAVAASVLLVVVFAGDLFLLRGVGSFSSADQMNYAMNEEMENAVEMDVMSAEPSDGVAELPMAVAAEAVGEAPAAEESAPLDAGSDTADDAADSDQGFNAQAVLPTATITPEGTRAPDQSRAAATGEVEPEEGIGGAESEKTAVTDGDAAEELQVYFEPEAPAAETRLSTFFRELPLTTLVELALFALAVSSGALALTLKRRRG